VPFDGQESYPLPQDSTLSEVAIALRDAGHWASVVDDRWRLVYVTDEQRRTFGGHKELARFAIGKHMYGPEAAQATQQWRFGVSSMRPGFAALGGLILADTPGGRDALRGLVDPSLRELIDGLSPDDRAMVTFNSAGAALGGDVGASVLFMRVCDAAGRRAGGVLIAKPGAGMSTISTLTSLADPRHLERMQRVIQAGRRSAALLFADIDGSTPLAKRLSTASYFALARRLVRAADQCVIDAGGLVGRHVGDGVVGFFLSETAGSDSSAARACITAARALRVAVRDVTVRSELSPDDVVMRFGLHWGATLYVGNISSAGRTEVTALGDEANEAARIEACASGGRALASKALIERLDPDDSAALGIDPTRTSYTLLADLPTATEKARRDAPAIAVCDLVE
jgi:class 3 adenylate cyclase